jgi:hypothetical protein
MGATVEGIIVQAVSHKHKQASARDFVSNAGPLLLNQEFLCAARTKLTDVCGLLRHIDLRFEHLSETLCFLPIAKLV